MPLSRHFYSLDEVQSSLLYTTTRNNYEETLFWCEELLESKCHAEAISVLFQSWLWNNGAFRLQWLIDAWNTLASEELKEDDIRLASYRLSHIQRKHRDSSLWNILISTIKNPDRIPDTVTKKTPLNVCSENEKELYFIRSIYQNKAQCAWWISQYISETRIWELLYWTSDNMHMQYSKQYHICLKALQNYEELLGYKSAEYDIIVRCMAIIMFCIPSEIQTLSFKSQIESLSNEHTQFLSELALISGRKNRRIFTIPSICLYGNTLRGCYKWSQNNFIQLNDIEKYLIGCPFWDEAISEYGKIEERNIIWNSDTIQESFYTIYFPDDIPDEWTKEDKLKSHGDGILGPNDIQNMWKYSRIFMSNPSYLAWNTSNDVSSYLKNANILDCNLENTIMLYKLLPFDENNLNKLKPVRKIKILL
jgi:hypothetical protein